MFCCMIFNEVFCSDEEVEDRSRITSGILRLPVIAVTINTNKKSEIESPFATVSLQRRCWKNYDLIKATIFNGI